MQSKDPVSILMGRGSAPVPPSTRTKEPAARASNQISGEEMVSFRAPDQPAGKARRKLWNLPHRFHCALIGTCLDVEDLRSLASRFWMEDLRDETDYTVHTRFVTLAGEKSPVSQRLQGLMDRKFRGALRRFNALQDENSLREQWNEEWQEGRIAGAFWALATHPATTRKLADEIYGEVHMLSHQVGAGNRADRRRLAELEDSCERLTERLQGAMSQANRHHREKQEALEEVQSWRERARNAEGRVESLEERLRAWEEGTEVRKLHQKIQRLERQLHHQAGKAERAERLLAERSEPEPRSKADTGTCAAAHGETGGPCAAREWTDLEGRCVLCVGGRSGLAHRYRQLVERYNGSFLHHDGGLEDSSQRLQQLLNRADQVVCPLDCVSHEATSRIKDHCKQQGVPCLLLESSGITAFARALPRLADHASQPGK
ncbi:DUF2325 domain-containing protein [Thiohalorhabdus sp. Cl-TMA]|uniref:DUF2325 domain-containing protein n=1 Tax=Thiohalorhabdus methylotrophus TaxID=3242694 RepID=A0ABV4U0Q7_9GAMM